MLGCGEKFCYRLLWSLGMGGVGFGGVFLLSCNSEASIASSLPSAIKSSF